MSNLNRFETTVIHMAASFRERYDFSTPDHFDSLAEYAVKSAEAIERKFIERETRIAALKAAAALDEAKKNTLSHDLRKTEDHE